MTSWWVCATRDDFMRRHQAELPRLLRDGGPTSTWGAPDPRRRRLTCDDYQFRERLLSEFLEGR